MSSKKLFILLPDGVGLRNFAFTSFVETGVKAGWETVFWNKTPFSLKELGYREISLEGKPRAFTDLLKRAKIISELNFFQKKFNDPVYGDYKFPAASKGLKNKLKNLVVDFLVLSHSGKKGLQRLRKRLINSERKSNYYKACKAVLEKEKPDFIFCTNQRAGHAIAPLTAAADLNIPTATFIFSWDNLPKATMVVETDYYFAWSDYMKKELLKFYPYIKPEQIKITGTPQFEPHFDPLLRKTQETFFQENNLDPDKEYICFSGDDVTTSPNDPQYLKDIAEAVQNLNRSGRKLGIIFRRCPVDFSGRYEEVLHEYHDIITPVAPKWKKLGERWNEILPTKEDLQLQMNTILHTEAVVNVGSSMVFDYAVFDKPCLFLNYQAENSQDKTWSTDKIYNFVHFRSMPDKDAVFWLNTREEIEAKLVMALNENSHIISKAKKWFEIINYHPPQKASERIWGEIETVI
ncbi:UDP-glycosyltransferase [Zunongwangia sp. H14]|uniref:UDP-glycosyltransferase n=1 Tax=Zunongwangia sp. H14 TaxID=3240792 RepID=UPI0035640F3F